jgi:protein-L-isoaspartate(D-aspartate) O-methyltransferase
MTDEAKLAAVREEFARDLMTQCPNRRDVVRAAFAAVPREQLSGPPPWRVARVANLGQVAETSDPLRLHADVTVAIDRERHLNSGSPGLWAAVFDGLELGPGQRIGQIGTGLGYFSAVLAEIVGPSGSVRAFEVDAALAARARDNLTRWPQVEVSSADGANAKLPEVDALLFFCGVTHVLPQWLECLSGSGRLYLPLTLNLSDPVNGLGIGIALRAQRAGSGFEARFTNPIGIYPCSGARTAQANAALHAAFTGGGHERVRSIRRDEHSADDTCWLHHAGACLSSLEVTTS